MMFVYFYQATPSACIPRATHQAPSALPFQSAAFSGPPFPPAIFSVQVQVAGSPLQPDTDRRRVNGTARPRRDHLLQRARTAHPSNNRRAPITAVPVPATERDSAARQCCLYHWHCVVLWRPGRLILHISILFKLPRLLLQ